MARLILGSSSPRRKQLLKLLRIPFDCVPPSGVQESLGVVFKAEKLLELAWTKAENVWSKNEDAIVIGADTVVVLAGRILGKPSSKEVALEMLLELSGKVHNVYTGVSVISKEWVFQFVEKTTVTFRELSRGLLKEYVDTGIPLDKAGAYGIQDYGALFVEKINGDFYNVMGLPVGRLWYQLQIRGVGRIQLDRMGMGDGLNGKC